MAYEHFWAKVDKSGQCWIWTGAKTRGYGQCTVDKRHGYAHRFSWEMENGPVPPGLVVCHKCDNPACVRPSHLFVGTQRDNVMDCLAKGRANRRGLTGASNPMARHISPDETDQIITLFSRGLGVREIAPRFGLSKSTIHNIVSGKHWSTANGI